MTQIWFIPFLLIAAFVILIFLVRQSPFEKVALIAWRRRADLIDDNELVFINPPLAEAEGRPGKPRGTVWTTANRPKNILIMDRISRRLIQKSNLPTSLEGK